MTRAAIPPRIPEIASGCQGILFYSSPPKDHIAPATSNRTIAFFLSKILLCTDKKAPVPWGFLLLKSNIS